ncbi:MULTISPECIES: AraC family transcriptional regulator [Pseudomonas]|jgi:AraC-like DNA-binding protein|uniref:AraC family transcriptional regulator n=4 Tax=Pseudomonas TaxID=286 RepID=A0A7Y1ACP4_PSEVE|nr:MULTISPECIES: AraC family transcriptional regulator [Pseudomonas]AAF80257.1 AraC-like regulatory protein [Pseudomonas sp. JR1]MBH1968593.1 AraC family transcriptional regulator [Pseudomonadales bacterium]KHK61784.1 AraC family transcriptional regulator [Pseudomonas frederiksbergensis]MBH2031247.1 AraC family transcriptional regulator [Pseudomonadales bacterium]MBH2075473.1 AraC family transcriptional regulator [Pseudomonadales bacterium]
MDFCLLHEKSQIFSKNSVDVVSGYANEHVGAHRVMQRRTSDSEASLMHRTLGSLDLFQMSYGSGVQITSPEREAHYHLHIVLKGRCMWRSCGEERGLAPGDLLLLNPHTPFDLTYSGCYEKFIIKLPASFIGKVCSENKWSYPSEGVRFDQIHRREQLDGFLTLLSLVCQEAETDLSIFQVKEHYAKIIVSKLLSLPISNVSREPLEGACQSFNRLEELIEKNIKQSISLEQLADLVHIGVHSLYALFDKHAGTTPMRFIRQRKLEAIRARLSDPQVAVSNVTEVALDYGFLHLGRFANYYKSTFGELPSDTLRRRG